MTETPSEPDAERQNHPSKLEHTLLVTAQPPPETAAGAQPSDPLDLLNYLLDGGQPVSDTIQMGGVPLAEFGVENTLAGSPQRSGTPVKGIAVIEVPLISFDSVRERLEEYRSKPPEAARAVFAYLGWNYLVQDVLKTGAPDSNVTDFVGAADLVFNSSKTTKPLQVLNGILEYMRITARVPTEHRFTFLTQAELKGIFKGDFDESPLDKKYGEPLTTRREELTTLVHLEYENWTGAHVEKVEEIIKKEEITLRDLNPTEYALKGLLEKTREFYDRAVILREQAGSVTTLKHVEEARRGMETLIREIKAYAKDNVPASARESHQLPPGMRHLEETRETGIFYVISRHLDDTHRRLLTGEVARQESLIALYGAALHNLGMKLHEARDDATQVFRQLRGRVHEQEWEMDGLRKKQSRTNRLLAYASAALISFFAGPRIIDYFQQKYPDTTNRIIQSAQIAYQTVRHNLGGQ